MKPCRTFFMLFACLIGASRPSISSAAGPEALLSITTPVAFKDVSDSDQVTLDKAATDLNLRLWRVKDTYNLEASIDVESVNQAILPTDERGRLTKESTSLGERPFIRFFFLNRPPVTVDVKCTTKECKALYVRAPIDPLKPQKFQVEVNIRGLKGKNWQAGFNQAPIREQAVYDYPDENKGLARRSFFDADTWWPDVAGTPYTRAVAAIRSVEDWTLKAGAPSEGFRRIRHVTRLALLKGKLRLELSGTGDFIETREIDAGHTLWLLPGQIAALANASDTDEAKLLRLEFDRAGTR